MCQVVMISAAFAQVNIVTPCPVEIGSQMTIKCSSRSVGGGKVFKELGTNRAVKSVSLRVGTEIWADYDKGKKVSRVKVQVFIFAGHMDTPLKLSTYGVFLANCSPSQ